jgi:hypothetical protein
MKLLFDLAKFLLFSVIKSIISDLIGLEAIWSGSGWSGLGKTAIWIGLD